MTRSLRPLFVASAALLLTAAHALAVDISAPSVVIPSGTTVQVPLSITDAPSASGYTGVDIALRFDSDVVSVTSVSVVGTETDGWDFAYNVIEDVAAGGMDDLLISAASGSPLNVVGTGTLLNVELTAVSSSSPLSTALTFQLAELNETGVTATPGSVKIGGTDGVLQLTPATILPGASVSIQLDDADLANDGTVQVEVSNSTTNDTETVTLNETGAGTGVFTGTIGTLFDPAGSATVDGLLGVKKDDVLTGNYEDDLQADGDGDDVAPTSDVVVLGGTTAVLVISGSPLYPGDNIDVELTDLGLQGTGSQTVTVTNSTTGDTETLTLTETGTGVFTASIPTEYDGVGTPTVNGTIGVKKDDVVTASFDDLVNDLGGPETISPAPGSELTILGGSTGTLTLSPLALTPGDALTIEVVDADLASEASIDVTVTNTTTNETETVTLLAAPPGSGTFSATLVTEYEAGTGTSGDGVLGIKSGDGVGALYVDDRNDDGGSENIGPDGGELTIAGGNDGSVAVVEATILPGDDVNVTLIDADLSGAGSALVTVRSLEGGVEKEALAVVLPETGTPGTFQGSISTVFSAAVSAGGRLDVQKDDEVQAEYDDALTAAGASVTVQSPTNVVVLGGVLGTLTTSLGVQAGDGFRIELADADLNTDDGTKQTVDVTVRNLVGGDEETVTLEETAVASGIFRIEPSLPTSAAGVSEDGVLQVSPQDLIEVLYDDAANDDGGPTTVTVSSIGVLFGDTSGNGSVRALDAGLVLQFAVSSVTFSEYQKLVGDVKPPYSVPNADDAVPILQFAVGLISEFEVQSGVPTPHPYKRLDVTRRLALGEPQAVDQRIRLPLLADDVEGLLSGKLVLSYDDEQVRVLDVVPSERTPGFMVASHVQDGQVRVAFAGAQIVGSGQGALLDVELEPLRPGALATVRLQEASLNGGRTPAQIADKASALTLPRTSTLLQNWPNPFNPETQIRYELATEGPVRLRVFDMVGQPIADIVDEYQPVGSYTVGWDGLDQSGYPVASGIYFYRLESAGLTLTRKMSLLR